MKTHINKLFAGPALVLGLGSALSAQMQAQTFTTLHSFAGGTEGGNPYGGLILSGHNLYGTTEYGGGSGSGTVFTLNTDSTRFTNLHSFAPTTAWNLDTEEPTNSEGLRPLCLTISGSTLYGVAVGGGSSGNGTVFKLNIDGTGFTNLHSFASSARAPCPGYRLYTNSDGTYPNSSLILFGDTLYGTAGGGGLFGGGTVFAIHTDSSGFRILHNFILWGPSICYTSTDGYSPSGLTLAGTTIYGTTAHGGSSDNGTVFSISTNGQDFTTLHSFSASYTNSAGVYTNVDGCVPSALILLGRTLYGTALLGGNSGNGTVFAINTDGTGFTTLHSFTSLSCCDTNGDGGLTNGDGALPYAGLVCSADTLYGTASDAGSLGWGTVFALTTNGMGFTTLHSFGGGAYNNSYYTNSDGGYLTSGLLLSSNNLYGTAVSGGASGYGTVFSISYMPQLTITRSAENVLVRWPANYAGFDYASLTLQSTTNLRSSMVWTPVPQVPVVVNGQITVTNPITGRQQLYRLSQ
jgi:uncharacterized repeat protein (TIGR03803 family)